MNDAQKALQELYDLLIEYDLEMELENSANDIDSRNPDPYHMRDAYARVVGVMEGARVALGIDWQAAGQKELL